MFFVDILLDALLDGIKILPFLFLVYLLIAYLEEHTDNKLYHKLTNGKWLGPIIGSTLGCLPQCGFSVVGANLYSKGLVTLGTLLAIFISTSDEAIPILVAHPGMMKTVGSVLGLKVLIAMVMGLVTDLTFKGWSKSSVQRVQVENTESVKCGCSHGCCQTQGNTLKNALLHTLKVFGYIVVINLILNGIIESIGEEYLSQFLLTESIWQPALAALIGLIPNCAASIVLTEMYVAGSLSIGALIAGLCTGAGVGLIMLFKANKNFKENLKIVGVLYLIGTAWGMLIQMIG